MPGARLYGALVVSAEERQQRQAPSPARVLVVEDDPDTRMMLAEMLATDGYELQLAANGRAALAVAERWPPDLILLDLLMPESDGWAFARAYHQTPLPKAPIIVLTASQATPDRLAPVEPVAALHKPFQMNDLLTLVRQYMRRR